VPVDAVIFDLDDTLVVEVSSADEAFRAACAVAERKYGIDAVQLHQTVRRAARELWHASPTHPYCKSVGISSWEGLWARFLGDGQDLAALRAWAPTYRHESWYRALAEHGVQDNSLADLLADTFRRERRTRHIVYPEVEHVLADLRKTYRLALLSNGTPDLQHEKIRGSNLGAYFDTIVISGEAGSRKPDPRIFELVLSRMQVAPETAVMLGNSLESDVMGAQQAGLKAIWVNREGKNEDGAIRPDAQIGDLTELKAILRVLI